MRLRLFLICILILQSIISIGQGINCGSYAKISNLNNGFRAGNIDVSGNQLTVEAVIHSQGPNVGTNSVISQDIVSMLRLLQRTDFTQPSLYVYLLLTRHFILRWCMTALC